MQFSSPLIAGTLLKRYKRFLADVLLNTGETITAACPNTGAMLGLNTPGSPVWLSRSENPSRKYPHTWELVEIDGKGLIGVNTGSPNKIVTEAVRSGLIPALSGFNSLRNEVKYGRNSRIDILLEDGERRCFVEVKNTHLFRKPGLVEFPDCVTERGRKHLSELADMVKAGHRAAMVYLVQAAFPDACGLAADLDPHYVEAFVAARKAGVEAFALCCKVTTTEISARRMIPVLDP